MSSTHGALIVFGSGPGVGRGIASLFAERGFEKVILLSRDAKRLAQDAEFVRSARAETSVHEIPCDLGNTEQVQKALKDTEDNLQGTSLEFVLFNAARTGRSDFFEFTPASLENDLKITVISLYAVAQWAVPKLLETAASGTLTPSFVATSGMLAKDPFPAMFSLATCKAAQYSLVHSLHKEFEPKGVHCAMVVIGGTVSDESKVTNARNIAKETWELFSEPQGKGRLEVMIMDPAYSDHIKNRER